MSDGAPPRGRWARITPDANRRRPRRETRILVVDDSASARKLMQAILLRLGVTLPELRLAATIDEALQTFAAWRPELVFLDVQLKSVPNPPSGGGSRGAKEIGDGVDLAGEFLSRNRGLQVVLCSATDQTDPRIRTLLTDPRTQFVVKPVVASRVQEALDIAARSTVADPDDA
ncbi:MAG: response regulator [Thermoplasmata archaeon]|nr:response regulator [Thermoplasmata archaeon]